MCLLLETIKLENGKLFNLDYHQQRFDKARQEFTGGKSLDLNDVINVPDFAKEGLFRCRVIYGKKIEKVEFIPHQFRDIKSLKIVHNNNIDYKYKYADRERLQSLFDQRGDCDDIIIIKNDEATDTFTGNLLFFDGKIWHTPKHPLLKGTQRQYLIDSEQITESIIAEDDISLFEKVGIINTFYNLTNMPVVKITAIKR